MGDISAVPLLDRSSSDSGNFNVEPRRDNGSSFCHILSRFLGAFSTRVLGVRCRKRSSIKRRAVVLGLNLTVFTILLLVIISVLDGIIHPSYANPPPHYQKLEEEVRSGLESGRGNPRNEKIFIASNIIQADKINGPWGEALLELVDILGPRNVFVSIYENDSGTSSAQALRHLASRLQCQHSIVSGAHLPLSGFPSVVLPNGQSRVKRITYLSEVRNQLLRPLDAANASSSNFHANYTDAIYDRILFLNDIYFKPIDATQLLFSTNQDLSTGRANYDVACAADFVSAVMFYDTFVVRDYEGYGMGLMFFPWFTSRGNAISRNDVLAEKDAVRVKSCWGGMVAFAAAPFQERIESTYPALRFWHQDELYWEASECCLLIAQLAAQSLSEVNIFLNPYIRVAYDAHSWSWMPFTRRIERVFKILQYVVSAVGYPEYNPRRLELPGQQSSQVRWVYNEPSLNGEAFRSPQARITSKNLNGKWSPTKEIAKPGGFCGQKRLFVMMPDVEGANREQKGKNWEKGIWP